jgi:DHA1 family bicyclomycin/chloramphenicol resistance-like MFS transporter
MYLPAFPTIASDLNASGSQIQLTLTAAMIGLALGQLIIGPMSDAWGRRRPLIVGLAVFVVASALCMFVPSAGVFIALRFVQGLAGAAGAVIARAVVRDHFDGDGITKFFSRLVLVSMLAPLLGPILGAQMLKFGPWQLGFGFLTGVSAISLVLVYFLLPESLPPEKRRGMNLGTMASTVRGLVTDARFIGPALTLALMFGGMFTYISTFSVVSQHQLGASAQEYSLIFAINTIGLLAGNQLNGLLIGKVETGRRLVTGIGGALVAVAVLGVLGVTGGGNLVWLTVFLFAMMFSLGLVYPNCQSLALASQPAAVAGTGSALLGTLQFTLGGSIPTLATWTASGGVTLSSMVTVMVAAIIVAVPVFALFARRASTNPS